MEESWLKETVPRNTRNSTKWSVKIFEEWQNTCKNKVAKNESVGFPCNLEEIQDVTVPFTELSPDP